MTQTTTFVPSGTPVTVAASDIPGNPAVAMPTVDGGNVDVLVTGNGPGTATINFGTSAPGLQGALGTITVGPGQVLLLTSNAAVIAATSSNQNVLTGVQPTLAASATFVAAASTARGTTVTIQRGTSTPRATF